MCESLVRTNGAYHKIRLVLWRSRSGKLESVSRLKMNLIPPIDGLQDGPHLVIAIFAMTEDSQIKINFRERAQQHKAD